MVMARVNGLEGLGLMTLYIYIYIDFFSFLYFWARIENEGEVEDAKFLAAASPT